MSKNEIAQSIDWAEADAVEFGDCDCEDPIPDPLAYELPNGLRVEIVGCAECGEAIEWEVEGLGTPGELREVIRSKQATIDQLKEELEEKENQIERLNESYQEELYKKKREIHELENNAVEPPEESFSGDTERDEVLEELRSERRELEAEVAQLQARLNERQYQDEGDDSTGLLRRVIEVTPRPSGETVSMLLLLGFTLAATWFVYPEIAPVVEAMSEAAEQADSEPASRPSPAIFVVMSVIVGGAYLLVNRVSPS